MAESAAPGSAATTASFWTNDEAWSVAWPAAIAFAMLFHGFAFVASEHAPQKVKPEPIEMAIAMPPPPPPPPEPPPPPPEPEKPPPPPPKVVKDLPPPPNETPKPEEKPVEAKPVTGISADSVAADSAGPAVRVGNTTFGDPNKEKFTPPQDVPKPAAIPFDAKAYGTGVFEAMNRIKQYPRKARVLGLEGRCIVVLLINRDGSLAQPPKMLGKGTGHDVLDAECIRMATEAAPFPPIVGDTETPVRVTRPIDFTLAGQ